MVDRLVPAAQRASPRALLDGLLVLTVAFVALAGLTTFGLVKAKENADRIARDERASHASALYSCRIQARGLPAGPHLVAALDDIHRLLMLPPTPQSRRQQQEMPPATRRLAASIVADLNAQLGAYVRIERSLPPTRVCQPR